MLLAIGVEGHTSSWVADKNSINEGITLKVLILVRCPLGLMR